MREIEHTMFKVLNLFPEFHAELLVSVSPEI